VSRPVWTLRYMRYHSAGEYTAQTFQEAVSVAMGYIEDGWAAPVEIIAPDGSVAADGDWLDTAYSRHWGVPSFEEYVAASTPHPHQPADRGAGAE
jgi:hypothetical protein